MNLTRRVAPALIVALMAAASNYPAAAAVLQAPLSGQGNPTADRISEENVTLLPALQQRGGVLTSDHRYVIMPGGGEVSVAPTSLSDCPSGWVCLWSEASYSGRLLRWNAAGTRVNLADYSFDNQMTSWANRGPYDARWFYNANYGGTTRCMNPGASTANVGSTDNDQASSLAIYTDSLACT